jgi:hypothetical protein
MKILLTLLIIFQIYSKDLPNELNPKIKLGIYVLVFEYLNTKSGITSLFLNKVNKNENHEEENYNSKITEKALEKQNIPSEYLPLYRKYNWLSPDIKSNTKFSGPSAGLSLSLASLLKKNIPKEEDESINFTLFATGELSEDNETIESIGALHEKLYAIEQFLIKYPEQKKSCMIALPKSQEWEYQLFLSENKKLAEPLFNQITEVKTIFIRSLPHDLPLLIEYINSNYSQTSYNYQKKNTYSIDINTIRKIQNNTLKTMLLDYSNNIFKKDKEKISLIIGYLVSNYNSLDFSDKKLLNSIPYDHNLHNLIFINEINKLVEINKIYAKYAEYEIKRGIIIFLLGAGLGYVCSR